MAGRRYLLTIVILAGAIHSVAVARSLLPAQDGLKFIRIARQFQTDPWPDVVRSSDLHPLYPALIAASQPIVARFAGEGPDAWRIAAQSISVLSTLGVLAALFFLTRRMFDDRIAAIAVAIFALLPIPAEVGRDTLSDSLGLFACLSCLLYGAKAIQTGDWRLALAAGIAGGLGYLARPEVILAPIAIGLAWLPTIARGDRWRVILRSPAIPAWSLSILFVVGAYALIKGEVSEKLALRHGASLGSQRITARPVPQWLPRGLNSARLDFSPKEESDHVPIRSTRKAIVRIAGDWWEEMCWGFGIMTAWGLLRQRFILGLCRDRLEEDAGSVERRLLAVFAAVFLIALLRHSVTLGYLSSRHTLPITAISMPWAAAGTFVCLRGLGVTLPWSRRAAWTSCLVASSVVVVGMVGYQLRPAHPSRWGHWAAGRWLAEHARAGDRVLDTRGWARFLSETPGYDYWHVRQALTDAHLTYVVVGHDELEAKSPRSETLGSLLAFAATPVQEFPSFAEGRNVGVRIYRFHAPESWEGMIR